MKTNDVATMLEKEADEAAKFFQSWTPSVERVIALVEMCSDWDCRLSSNTLAVALIANANEKILDFNRNYQRQLDNDVIDFRRKIRRAF